MAIRRILMSSQLGLLVLVLGCSDTTSSPVMSVVAAPKNNSPVVLKEGTVKKDEDYLVGRVVVDGVTVTSNDVRVHIIDMEKAKKIGYMLPSLVQESTQTRTNKDGVYLFHNITPGSYRVFLSFDSAKFKDKKSFPYSNAIETPMTVRTGRGKTQYHIDVKLR